MRSGPGELPRAIGGALPFEHRSLVLQDSEIGPQICRESFFKGDFRFESKHAIGERYVRAAALDVSRSGRPVLEPHTSSGTDHQSGLEIGELPYGRSPSRPNVEDSTRGARTLRREDVGRNDILDVNEVTNLLAVSEDYQRLVDV